MAEIFQRGTAILKDLLKVTEVNLTYHNKIHPDDRPTVKTSKDAYDLFMRTWDKEKIELQEQFRMILLDRQNHCMGITTVATGGIAACHVDLKLAFATALKGRATGIIVAHNHPSGCCAPSENDKSLTSRFIAAGKILDLPILDHLVVTSDKYLSFADEGLLTFNL